MIRAEREKGEVSGVLYIAKQEVAEAVAHGYGVGDLRTADTDALVPLVAARAPEVAGCGGVEHTVFACNLEALNHLVGRVSVVVVL